MDPDSVPPYRHRAYRLDPDPDDTEPKMKPTFISWKGLKSTFGRWNLWVIVAIHAICVYGIITAGHWAGQTFAAVVIAIVWVGGRYNWKALLKIDHSRKDGHTEEVCDNCDPIQMRDGGPVTNIVWWYAAAVKISREEAQAKYNSLSLRGAIRHLHNEYLEHDKFKNYPRPWSDREPLKHLRMWPHKHCPEWREGDAVFIIGKTYQKNERGEHFKECPVCWNLPADHPDRTTF